MSERILQKPRVGWGNGEGQTQIKAHVKKSKKNKALKIFMCVGCHNKIASIREDEDLRKIKKQPNLK